MNEFAAQGIQLIRRENIDALSASAALSYQDYPLFQYFVGTPYNLNVANLIMSASIKSMGMQAIGIAFGDKAFAIFAKPNYSGTPPIPFLVSGGLKLAFSHSPALLLRLLNYESYAMKMKQRHADEDCWYLYTLTVVPDHQHKGLASKVLRPMLDFFDATGQSCYLETHKAINVPLYEHFGFCLVETGTVPGTNLTHYAMLRKPCV